MKTNFDRTLVVKNIIAKYTNMKQYMKYLCAVLLVIGSYASAWGANATYYVWDSSRNDWVAYIVQDENATVVEGPMVSNGKKFVGWHIWNPDVYPYWKTGSSGYILSEGGSYYTEGGESSTKYIRYVPNTQGNTAEKNTGKNESDNKFYAVYASGYTDWTKDADWSASSTTQVTITFNKNDANATGTMASQIVLSNTTTYLQICEFGAPTGKVFGGWATSSKGSVTYSDQGTIRISSNTTLYAVWVDECTDISKEKVNISTITPVWNCSTNQWEATVSWGAVTGASRYGLQLQVYDGEWTNSGAAVYVSAPTTSYTYTNLTSGKRYRVGVAAQNQSCVPNTNTGTTASSEFNTNCPAVETPTVFVSAGNTSAELLWEATGATGCDMEYDVVVKKHSDNSTAWSVSGTTATGGIATGLTSNTTYDVYVTATNDCGNSNNNGGAYVEQFTTMRGFTDNKWTCIDLRLVQTDGNTSDPLLITGGYGLGTSSVEASRTLTLTIGGVAAKSTVQLSGTGLKFFKDNGSCTEITSGNLTCDASGNLSAVIHVAYAPAAYTNDEIATPGITVTCDGNERTFNDLVKARCLPEKFVIAAKINGRWCALPADLATSTSPDPTLPEAYPISVDNESTPRVAKVAPKKALYGFSARNAVTSHVGGIRLDTKTTDGNDGHLQAPRSNDLTYMWRNSGNASTGMQDWYLTSTGTSDAAFYNYNIGVDPACTLADNTTPISRYLCVYGNKIMWTSSETASHRVFRILPVEEEIDPVDMQIVEWKADKVRFMYFGPTTYTASVEINGVLKSAAPAAISTLSIDHGVYEIAVSDLMTSAYKQLYIIIKNGDTEVGRKAVTVPLLVNTTTTIDAARTAVGISNKSDCQNVDLVVLSGGKLSSGETTEDSQFTFNSISVYGGGKLILPEGNYLTTKKMYMRAGTVNSGTYQYVYPQVYVGTNAMLTINDNIINFDYLTTKNQYYALALPFPTTVDNAHITYPVDIYGETYAKGGSYLMDIFNGATRAAQGAVDAVWEDVEDVETTRGLGYYFLGMPRKVSVNGGSATRQEYGIQRIQMSTSGASAIKDHENGDTQIAVTAHPASHPYNAGWWLLGNPYMADLGGAGVTDDGTNKEITMGYLTNAGGTWDWAEKNVRYLTVPNDDASDTYDQRPVSGYNFPAFKTFFVQVGKDGYVKFGHASRSAAAPMRFSATGMPAEIETSIALNSELFGDTAHILIGDAFTDDYEPGDDLVKMPHANVSLFTINGENELFANALNMQSTLAGIPVGYTAPTSGTYVFSRNDKVNSSWIGSLWLTDYTMNQRVDLMEQNYVFTTDAGTNKARFVLNVELRSPGDDTPTDVEKIEDADEANTRKFIHQDKMYIQFNGVIYDATGKRVKEINK